jgi:hypothetical protein
MYSIRKHLPVLATQSAQFGLFHAASRVCFRTVRLLYAVVKTYDKLERSLSMFQLDGIDCIFRQSECP